MKYVFSLYNFNLVVRGFKGFGIVILPLTWRMILDEENQVHLKVSDKEMLAKYK